MLRDAPAARPPRVTLDPGALGNPKLPVKPFTEEQTREIVFKLMLDTETHHVVQLDGSGPADYLVTFFARQLLKELRLVGVWVSNRQFSR